MNLVPWSPRKLPTLFVDVETGRAYTAERETLQIGAGTALALRDVLDLAGYVRAERVFLTGANPGPAWFLADLPDGWAHGSHHLDHEAPTGRYTLAGARVEVRRAAEWFGRGSFTPAQAAAAWTTLGHIIGSLAHGAGLLGSPGATGRELWLHSVGRDPEAREAAHAQVSPEVAELLRATSGQHRIELRPPAAETMPGLWIMDGRLMYAAMVRELGTAAGARMATGAELAELLATTTGRFARGWVKVRATVPEWWDHVGILPLAGADGEGWEYPNTPGRTFTTWCDTAELHLARREFAWDVEPIEGVIYGKGRPLDTWAARLLRAYNDPTATKLVRAALRAMLLYAVGAWHSSGRTESTVTAGAMTRPAGDGWGAPERTAHGALWRRTVPLDGRAALMAHPELSTQIWGRARARVLWAPTAVKGSAGGALMVDPTELVSIYGDAVMTTTRPTWGAPVYDDGKVGRLRVKGHLCGSIPWPATARERDAVMHRAELNPCTTQH